MDLEDDTGQVDRAWRDLLAARAAADEEGVRAATARLRELDDLRIVIDRRVPLTRWQRAVTHRWVVPTIAGLAAALSTIVIAALAEGIPTEVLVTALVIGALAAWIALLATPDDEGTEGTDAMRRAAGSWFQGDG